MKEYTRRAVTFWGALLTATVGAFTIIYSMKSLPEGYLWGWLWVPWVLGSYYGILYLAGRRESL